MTVSVKLHERTRKQLRVIAALTGETLQDVAARIVSDAYADYQEMKDVQETGAIHPFAANLKRPATVDTA